MSPASDLYERLPWDSAFFGLSIARFRSSRVSPEDVNRLMQEPLDCCYLTADASDIRTSQAVARPGILLVDVRTELSLRLEPTAVPTSATSVAVDTDIPWLEDIAQGAHRDSRFYYDPGFPDPLCDKLYRTWVTKSCQGYADRVLVVRQDTEPVGYVTCHLEGGGVGRIGLLGVAERARHRGLGSKLIDGALEWFRAHGTATAMVATQGRNVSAQRLYQKSGFRSCGLHLMYHVWPRPD